MSELLPCPFCGGEAHISASSDGYGVECWNRRCIDMQMDELPTEAEAIAAWNSRAAMEFDNWFYLPKPKESIVEVTETTHAWDGTKVKTDVFYQVQEQAVIAWAKELDEHIIRRICEVWNSRAERTCAMIPSFTKPATLDDCQEFCCSACGEYMVLQQFPGCADDVPNYCPICGARRVGE